MAAMSAGREVRHGCNVCRMPCDMAAMCAGRDVSAVQ